MLHLIEGLSGWALQLIQQLGYAGIFIVMILEIVFPPIPSEVVIPFAGHLAGLGRFSFSWVVIVGTAGSVGGAIILYFAGWVFQEAAVRRFVQKFGRYMFILESDLDTTLAWFRKHGEVVTFFGRIVPIVRSLISIPAGFSRMGFGKFLLFTAAGSAIWTFLLTLGGKVFGENYIQIRGFIDRYEKVIIVLIIGAAIWFVWRRVLKPRRAVDA